MRVVIGAQEGGIGGEIGTDVTGTRFIRPQSWTVSGQDDRWVRLFRWESEKTMAPCHHGRLDMRKPRQACREAIPLSP